MKKLVLLPLLAAVLILSGCSHHAQVENQAFLLVMGLDRTADGQIEMSVQIPRIAGNSDSADGAGSSNGSANYAQMSVTGASYEEALERLDWVSPRDLNPAQLKLVVISRDLAESDECPTLINHISQTERLFTATRVAVCEGSAKEFVSSIKPTVGTRLSTDISAMFDHYIGRGFIPRSRLADLYYLMNSVYSDPMTSYAVLEPKALSEAESGAQPASALAGDLKSLSSSFESDIATRYLGAAVFSGGRMRGVLDGEQTICANLLLNELDSFFYNVREASVELIPEGQIKLSVDTQSNPIRLRVKGKLSLSAEELPVDEEELIRSLRSDIENTIRAAQRMGVEPFGFAEAAARHFSTIEDWVNYGWKRRYLDAQVEVDISLTPSDS